MLTASTCRLQVTSRTGEARRPTTSSQVPDEASAAIHGVSAIVTYGWGVIPVKARIREASGRPCWFPREGRYLMPIKDVIRVAEGLAVGDTVAVQIAIRL